MELQKIETLLLQEMEEVKGGFGGVCTCEQGAGESTASGGTCNCDQGAGQQLEGGGSEPIKCNCDTAANAASH